MQRVLIFGTFDGVHEGHRSLFAQAREHGDELVAVVARDDTARQLKRKTPRHPEEERRQQVAQEPLVDRAVLGDEELSSWRAVQELQPDVICLGYDQGVIAEDLTVWLQAHGREIPLVRLDPHEPDLWHNSHFDK